MKYIEMLLAGILFIGFLWLYFSWQPVPTVNIIDQIEAMEYNAYIDAKIDADSHKESR